MLFQSALEAALYAFDGSPFSSGADSKKWAKAKRPKFNSSLYARLRSVKESNSEFGRGHKYTHHSASLATGIKKSLAAYSSCVSEPDMLQVPLQNVKLSRAYSVVNGRQVERGMTNCAISK